MAHRELGPIAGIFQDLSQPHVVIDRERQVLEAADGTEGLGADEVERPDPRRRLVPRVAHFPRGRMHREDQRERGEEDPLPLRLGDDVGDRREVVEPLAGRQRDTATKRLRGEDHVGVGEQEPLRREVRGSGVQSPWFFPSQPLGRSWTWTTRSRGSSAAIASRIAPVASVERSSTAISSRAG